MTKEQTLLREIKKGLLGWYDFVPGRAALYIGRATDPVAELLREKGLAVETCALSQAARLAEKIEGCFDYLISVADPERSKTPEKLLFAYHRLLKDDGVLLLGMNNRFGLRFLCGDRDLYTDRVFDGIENYWRAYLKPEDEFRGRAYAREEIAKLLDAAGFPSQKFYSLISHLDHPNMLFAEGYLPNEDLATRIFPTYHYPKTVFLEEEYLYDSLIKNGLFHGLANAWLIECPKSGKNAPVLHVTSSLERGREKAIYTLIREDNVVEKKAAYPEGEERLADIARHHADLEAHGLRTVGGRIENGRLIMQRIDAKVGQLYLKELLVKNKKQFLETMDHFRDLILKSSETEVKYFRKTKSKELFLRHGYLDLVPLNSFFLGGEFVFFDQEFCEDNYPANALITRMVATFYAGNPALNQYLRADELYARYGMTEHLDVWHRYEWDFLAKLRQEKALRSFHEANRRDGSVTYKNRLHMNYSAGDFERLFVDVFRDADTRKMILFGSGLFARKFLDMYGRDYEILALLDNRAEKWGSEVEGVPVRSPQYLKSLSPGEYKVIVCIKNYLSVMNQLDAMGVHNYSIFDPAQSYPDRPRRAKENVAETKKRFHKGYISGVFDLFHKGHLNLIKRAKEQCDYLIVGVVTDEGVEKYKKVRPYIPFEERLEIVAACRYVDEAVAIPYEARGIEAAYQKFRFDCQFCGSDYEKDPAFRRGKKYLEEHGAELVIFPYTEGTSSTKIKGLIDGEKE